MICQHGFLSYLIAAKESICFHTLLSLKLYFAKDENIFSTGYVDPVLSTAVIVPGVVFPPFAPFSTVDFHTLSVFPLRKV